MYLFFAIHDMKVFVFKTPLTFILVMMVLKFKKGIDLLEQCVIKKGEKVY